jgi:drug/metabolite transporter (DMT)-like permease
VATAAAPYAVVPIVAGVALLHERPRVTQWAGIALVIAGLILLGLVS